MLRLAIVFLLFLVPCANAQALDQYRWKQRLLLVFADAHDSSGVAAYRDTLRESRCELELRDVQIGWFFADAPARIGQDRVDEEQARSVRAAVQPAEGVVTVVLIGKDGGIKSRYDRPPAPAEIFALIDGMPMRRAEMRRQGLSGAGRGCPESAPDAEPTPDE